MARFPSYNRFAAQLSKLPRDFQSQGYQISKNTVFDYAPLLEDAGLRLRADWFHFPGD